MTGCMCSVERLQFRNEDGSIDPKALWEIIRPLPAGERLILLAAAIGDHLCKCECHVRGSNTLC